MACPICKSHQFYVKDPSDEYEIYEFECRDGQIRFAEPETDGGMTVIGEDQEIFCQSCAWHGKKSTVN